MTAILSTLDPIFTTTGPKFRHRAKGLLGEGIFNSDGEQSVDFSSPSCVNWSSCTRLTD